MSNKVKNIFYWISTLLMCGIFLFSAQMYLRNPSDVASYFEMLHYPTNLVYPLAVAKILGVLAVLSNISKVLKEWAYAGFFFDAVLASLAHWTEGHGIGLSFVAIALVLVSRAFWKKN